MPTYRYTAKDVTGKNVTGISDAMDQRAVIDLLRKQALVILSIQEEKKQEKVPFAARMGGKVKLGELVLFSRQLATMIDSGIPLVQALEILSEQIENHTFKKIISDVKRDVSAGASFCEALAKHPKAFSPLFVQMVKAGESSGSLDDIMDRLAGYLEKTDHLVRKVRAAMIYPAVVTTMAVLITLVLMLKVVPVFKSMFQDFGGQLPLPTQVLVTISDLLIHTFFIWTGASVAALFLLKRYLSTEKGVMVLDTFKLKMPVFGVLFRKVAVSKFSRTLATLVKSGVPILNALEIVGKTAGNKVIENAVEKVRAGIREGESITAPLSRSNVFPPLVVRMIAVGEQTGELEKMLSKIADFYDDQVDAAVSGLTSLIEPLVIAFLGVVIGGIVICMFLPIFKISTLVQ
ncbi:MAG: type II secretion system F family protein [Candidatus Omnitrophica bacterium]|nr:type II secretion system F family protein [Candidatus Omnitrophota bacterium]